MAKREKSASKQSVAPQKNKSRLLPAEREARVRRLVEAAEQVIRSGRLMRKGEHTTFFGYCVDVKAMANLAVAFNDLREK